MTSDHSVRPLDPRLRDPSTPVFSHDGIARFRGQQGRALGRPGEVRVEVQEYGGEAYSVRVAGNAIIVFETRIQLPSRG